MISVLDELGLQIFFSQELGSISNIISPQKVAQMNVVSCGENYVTHSVLALSHKHSTA